MACIAVLSCVLVNLNAPPVYTKHFCQYKNPKLLVAIGYHESRLQHQARSSTGDIGIMQINKKIWQPITRCDIRKLPCNIKTAARLLRFGEKKCRDQQGLKCKIQYYNYNSPNYAKRVLLKYRKVLKFAKKCEKIIIKGAKAKQL